MKRFTTMFIFCCLLLSGASAEAAGINVSNSRGFNSTLNVECPKINLIKTDVLGVKAYAITAPDANIASEKDAPALPKYTAMVMIDPSLRPVFQVTSLESEIVEIDARIMPSKGNFTRNISPESVPFNYGSVYSADEWYPSEKDMVKMGEPFIFRDVRGVNLIVSPVQYNPVKNKLRIHKNIRVSIGSEKGNSKNTLKVTKNIANKVFEPIYKNTFVNYKRSVSRLPRLDENGRLVIICHDEFMGAMKPFVEWKKKTGLEVTMVPMSEVGSTNTDVKAFLQDEYNQGGMTHVILVGDSNHIPTNKGVRERADSDPCYVKLAGDDHVPDSIISRISAADVKGVEYQVAKVINYERFPTSDASWYTRLLGIGSDEGQTPDYIYIDQLREELMDKGLFKSAEKAYDPGANVSMVVNALNKGVSLINYLGHGSGTSWATSRFSSRNMAELANGWKMPIIWDVACLNGRFVNTTGFGEAWMRIGNIENPAGSVAYIGGTTNMEWVPPIKVQAEINKHLIGDEVYKTVGAVFMNGVMKGLELYTADPRRSGVMIFEQWHLFGDCTMNVRFKAPVKVKTENKAVRSEDMVKVSVNVTDEDGKAVSNARVTAYTEGVKDIYTVDTDEEGVAVIEMPAETTAGYVTIMHADIVPVVDEPIVF